MKRILCYILLLLLAVAGRAAGTVPSDSLVVGLLTCSPGSESYSLYGHTALRVRNVQTDEDYTFNYGVFSFDAPGFVWRFVLGETDYTIDVTPTPLFLDHYRSRRRSVTEQRLRLTEAEANRLLAALAQDANTPGWTYRYNFLGDNCTSRAVRMVEEALDGRLVLLEDAGRVTFRDIIHSCSLVPSPWNAFGQDLLLGADVDTALSVRAELAFPLRAERLLDGAVICRPDGRKVKLVDEKRVLVDGTAMPRKDSALGQVVTPAVAAFFVLLLALVVGRRKRAGKALAATVFDYTALTVQGAAGCIVFVLFFFSEHPSVDSNYLLLFLNPLPLLWLPVKALRERHGRRDCYVTHVQPLLLAGLAVAAFQQKIPTALVVLALSLLVRSASEWLLQKKKPL